jgi:hypothetical protein
MKCPCGKESIGRINGAWFCGDPHHIEAATFIAMSPFQRAIARAKEQALIDFTDKYVVDHPDGYDGPCLCRECKENA